MCRLSIGPQLLPFLELHDSSICSRSHLAVDGHTLIPLLFQKLLSFAYLCLSQRAARGFLKVDVDRLSFAPPAFVLALAKVRSWMLLTGDNRLRRASNVEGVEVHGTL